jgi:hypothetical protein
MASKLGMVATVLVMMLPVATGGGAKVTANAW